MPFVAQASLDASQAYQSELRADLKEARAEIARLTDTLVQMKRQGFNPPPPTVQVEAPAELPDEIMQAIGQRMDITSRIGRQVAQQARAWLQSGTDESVVLHKILYGSVYEPEEDGA